MASTDASAKVIAGDDGSVFWSGESRVDCVSVGELGVLAACSVMEGPSWTGSVRWIAQDGEEQDLIVCPSGAPCVEWVGRDRFVVGLDSGDMQAGTISADGDMAKAGPCAQHHDSTISAVHCKDDGATLLTASWDYTLRAWDLATLKPQMVFEGHGGRVSSGRWKPKEATFASVAQDLTLRMWDARTAIPTATLRLAEEPLCVDWELGSDATLIVGFADGRLGKVDTRKPAAEAVQLMDHANGCVTALCQLPEAPHTLFTASDDTVVRKVDGAKCSEVLRHGDYARSVALWKVDGAVSLLSGGWDSCIRRSPVS